MTNSQILLKRFFDLIFSALGLLFTFPIIIISVLIATIETRSFGLFFQNRIGKDGKNFKVIKVKTMYDSNDKYRSSITTLSSGNITKSGCFFRKTKIDELPQLLNVLLGSMSFVGPRPDVPGYADKLTGRDAIILSLRPGITGPASLKYHNEEYLLSQVSDPLSYNDNVIWPDKVKINLEYYNNFSLLSDIRYILNTVGVKC